MEARTQFQQRGNSARDPYRPAVWRNQSGQQTQERALPRAIGSHYSHILAAIDFERNILQGVEPVFACTMKQGLPIPTQQHPAAMPQETLGDAGELDSWDTARGSRKSGLSSC